VLDCKSSSDFKQLANKIQREQQRMLFSTDYHVRATSTMLNLDSKVVRSALVRLGCRFMPSAPSVTLPEDMSEMCTVMLHLSQFLAKVCPYPQKEWQRWLDHTSVTDVDNDLNISPEVAALSRALSSVLAAADNRIVEANEQLVAKGFLRPNLKHLQQAAQKLSSDVDVPIILINAAATMFHTKLPVAELSLPSTVDVSTTGVAPFNSYPPSLLESEECLGFWGFRDSGFSLQLNKKGSYVVVMRGQRYSVSGRPLLKLLPFVEAETGVKIDPFNETFKVNRQSLDKKSDTEMALTEKELTLLQSTVQKVSLSLPDRIRHGTGHSQQDVCAIRDEKINNLRVPDAVVWPHCEDEVQALIAVAMEKSWCLIPFGGGTNVTQATRCPPKEVEPRPILSVDMTKMNRLQWLNEEDGLACFEAGINGRDLIAVLEQRGYTMGHEPDSIEFSTLGGWIATKASGMKRNKYGNIEDIVRGVRVASSSGRISQGGRAQNGTNENPIFGRASCGLDFLPMILGSEGCLGIITSAVVKVCPLPETKEYESVLFMSFDCGLGFVRDIAKLDRMIPASVRLLDNEHFRLGQALRGEPSSAKERILGMMQSFIAAGRVGNLDPKSVACATVCYEGKRSEVQLQQAELKRVAKDHGGILLGAGVGKAGYDMTFLIAYLRDFAMTYHFLGESFETFAPWSKVGSIIEKTKRRLNSEHETRCLPGKPFVGCRVTQLYQDGVCLYFYFCMNTENVKDASHVFSEIEHAARCEILKQGGNLSHHHGIGKVRAAFLQASVPPAYKRIVESVKESMDPQNIFAAANGLFGI
jgi:alkyldihydroxyacetonephosphate synthase